MGLDLENPLEVSTSQTVPLQRATPVSGTEQILTALAKGDLAKFNNFFARVRQAYPEEITQIALRHIAVEPVTAAAREMTAWLAADNAYLALLFDPVCLSLEDARRAMDVMRGADARFAVKLSRVMEEVTAADRLVRALTLIEDIEDYSAFYPRLCTLTWHPDNYIRSKAVLALCKVRPNRSLIDRQLESSDGRVRANAIEALWHAPVPSATRVFREALGDSHHRVVVNALIGLYHHKDESFYDKMVALAGHPEPRFRAALAWAIGQIREEKLTPLLHRLAADSSPEVRARAQASLAAAEMAAEKDSPQ